MREGRNASSESSMERGGLRIAPWVDSVKHARRPRNVFVKRRAVAPADASGPSTAVHIFVAVDTPVSSGL